MTRELKDVLARYVPQSQPVPDLAGLSLGAASQGETVEVLQRAFLSSYDDDHRHYFAQILGQFAGLTGARHDHLLIVIREGQARLHREFPMTLNVRPKVPLEAGTVVAEDQVLDIEEVRSRDMFFEADVRDGDKIVWLFRVDWSFGLYFDFSGKLTTSDLWPSLGRCYRAMRFHSLYSFFSRSGSRGRLIDRGWFPFIQFTVDEFRQLRVGIEKPSALDSIEESLVAAFPAERIDHMSSRWWTNPVLLEKKKIINAGLQAYKEGSDAQVINCIKNLISEVEGTVRLHFHRNFGRRPTTKEFKEHVSNQAKAAFPSSGSLAFPELFSDYLAAFLFRPFDLRSEQVELSRHSVTHGVANPGEYTRMRALQVVLCLDQIHYYTSGSSKHSAN